MKRTSLLATITVFTAIAAFPPDASAYYHAQMGRFINRDPIGYRAGDANVYRYVGNGPMTTTDPAGLKAYGKVTAKVGGILGDSIFSSSACISWEPPKAWEEPNCECRRVRLYQIAYTREQFLVEDIAILNRPTSRPPRTVNLHKPWHRDPVDSGGADLADWVRGAGVMDEAGMGSGVVTSGDFAYLKDDFGRTESSTTGRFLARWHQTLLLQAFETCAVCTDSKSSHFKEVLGCVSWGHIAVMSHSPRNSLEMKALWIGSPFSVYEVVRDNAGPDLNPRVYRTGSIPTASFLRLYPTFRW